MFNSTKKCEDCTINKDKNISLEVKNRELSDTVYKLEREHKSEVSILKNELDMRISKEVKVKDDEISKLKQENAVLLKEKEILNKAFENMWFDVKDMKSILDKLVEWIIGKNVVNVIK